MSSSSRTPTGRGHAGVEVVLIERSGVSVPSTGLIPCNLDWRHLRGQPDGRRPGACHAAWWLFCRSLPRPWHWRWRSQRCLTWSSSLPWVTARQGVALGVALLGLVALGKKSARGWFVFWVRFGGDVFHKTAVLLLPLAALAAASHNRFVAMAWRSRAGRYHHGIRLPGCSSKIQLREALWSTYVEAEYQSVRGRCHPFGDEYRFPR